MDFLTKIINLTMNLGAEYFCRKFEADTKRAGIVNQQVLMEILQTNSQSEFGRQFDFRKISDTEQYKMTVPLSSYGDYESAIACIASGQQNVLTSQPIEYFGLTSGTTGQQKMIPVTAAARKITNLNMNFLRHGLLCRALPIAKAGGKALLLMNILDSGTTPVGIPTGAGTSQGMKSMKKLLPYLWTSPLEVYQQVDQQLANYLHLIFALQEPKLAYIVAPFPAGIVQLLTTLENHWPQLIKDIATGIIGKDLQLAPTVKNALEQRLAPNPQRAAQLEAELLKGMEGIIPRIWPTMYYVCCVLGGSFSIYIDKLKYYSGQLPLFSAVYCATEALIGMSIKTDDVTYVVTPSTAYFEFIPIITAESTKPPTLNLDQLVIGQCYEVVITNYAGFYRYRLGDVVKVVDYYNHSPVIEFCYRKGQLLNIAGEKTSEQAVQQAVQETIRQVVVDAATQNPTTAQSLPTTGQQHQSSLQDYTVCIDVAAPVGYYKFYIEVSQPLLLDPHQSKLRDLLELTLCELNPRYLAGRQAGRITPLAIQLVKPGTFTLLRQELLRRGASANQVKTPRMVSDVQLIQLLEQNRIEG